MLTSLKEQLEDNLGIRFNSVLANLYRDGHDHVPWHSDDKRLMRSKAAIASLSFGDVRNFELRKKPPPVSEIAALQTITVIQYDI